MSLQLSERFITAFIEVEKELRRLSGIPRGDSHATFSTLLDRVADKNAVVRRFRDDLKQFAELRNAIVHERRDGLVIAEPHAKTVGEIEAIRNELLRPVRLEERFLRSVATCSSRDPVGKAAHSMFKGGFSQVPVYDDSRFSGLLTAETITRWLGANLSNGIGLVEEVSVGEVLGFTEDPDHWKLVSRRRPVLEILEMFEASATSGKSLDAVIMTKTGERTEPPVGILTAFDIPQLYSALGSR